MSIFFFYTPTTNKTLVVKTAGTSAMSRSRRIVTIETGLFHELARIKR